MKEKIGWIGMGHMGYAMLKGALRYKQPSELAFNDRYLSHMEEVKKETGVEFYRDKKEMLQNVKYSILAIKPQSLLEVAEEIKGLFTKEQIIISILPGVTIKGLKEIFKTEAKIVRAMPNTPALIGEGMTGISFSKDSFTEEEKQEILICLVKHLLIVQLNMVFQDKVHIHLQHKQFLALQRWF